jgi:serine/threonine-protein kinase ULK2
MIAQIKQIGDYSYDVRFLLGEGAFGRVYKGQKKGSSEAVAIKKIDLIAFEKDQYMKQSLCTF